MSQINQVKEASDIVTIIGERISLSRSGRNFKALCPFHSEKSPSFYVSSDLQMFNCFGCHEKGDVITFLEKYDHLTFAEALKYLADRAGIKLESFKATPEDESRERLFAILELAKDFYHYLLTTHQVGQVARDYLKERQITSESLKLFRLGYAQSSWDGLIKFLHGKKKYSLTDLESAGLIIRRNNARSGSTNPRDYYDRFRGRIIFPLADHRGRIVGFSGRVLDKDAKEAKYINTPETLLYHKSRMLFGFSELHRAIREAKSVLIMEGEFDVISSVQAHVANVVAIKGSALTKEHLELLQRSVDTIILSLDSDDAGVEATRRSIQLVHEFPELRLRVLPGSILQGKDPDDLARHDPKAWRQSVKQTVSAYQFLIDIAFDKYDQSSGEGKQQIVSELAKVLISIPHAVEKAYYVKSLADRLGVSESVLQQDLNKVRLPAAPRRDSSADKTTVKTSKHPLLIAESHLLSVLIQLPEGEVVEASQTIDPEQLQLPAHQTLVRQIQQLPQFQLQEFSKQLPDELQAMFSSLYFDNLPSQATTRKELQDALTRYRQLQTTKKLEKLTLELKQLEQKPELTAEEETQMNQLLQQIVKLRGRSA